MEGSHFPPAQGTFRKIGVQFWRKVDVAGYTRRFSDTAGGKWASTNQLCPFHAVNK